MNLGDIIKSLKEALQLSPSNIPLRKLLANNLFMAGYYEEAEKEFVYILESDNMDNDVKLSLAKSYYNNSKTSTALVVLEELVEKEYENSDFFLFYSQVLSSIENYDLAITFYQKSVNIAPELKDEKYKKELYDNLKSKQAVRTKVDLAFEAESDEIGFLSEIEKPKINFSEVGGMDKVKEEISFKIILPLKNPEIYKAYGKSIGGGILLYGPPGCGKTLIARATAGEVDASFISVGINEILDMYLGQSEKNLHSIFSLARRNTPCVLFFDEVDALGANRNDLKQNWFKTIINQFLDELDGVKYSNEGILVLAATNAPWHIDPAFKRPGRFDRQIFVAPPDINARKAIIELSLADKPHEKIDTDLLAKISNEYSGADIKAVVDLAIESKIYESMRKGIAIPLNTADIKNVVSKYIPTTREWMGTAKNYATFSNESGQYDAILEYLNLTK